MSEFTCKNYFRSNRELIFIFDIQHYIGNLYWIINMYLELERYYVYKYSFYCFFQGQDIFVNVFVRFFFSSTVSKL